MGSWFSNLHIRKNGKVTAQSVVEYIRTAMAAQQYQSVAGEEEADGAFAILSGEGSQWISVYSDLFSFDDPKLFTAYAHPMSAALATDVLGISCFDSDFLYLNLIDAAGKVDAWAGVGSAAGSGIRKRINLSAWKKKVDNFAAFKESVKKKYVFAEEVLGELEPCVHLPQLHSAASYEYLADLELKENVTYLYFKLPETAKTQEMPRLMPHNYSLMPCFLNKPSTVSVINAGGASKGLSVFFIGPYVEQEEITFSDVCFVEMKNNKTTAVPFELQKVQLTDGQWAYYYHDSGYKILPKVDERMPMIKRMRVEFERSIVVRFVPHGDPRKVLDITVVLVPDKNPEGNCGWNVWHQFGSKEAFIAHHNQHWSKIPNASQHMLRAEDFD